MSRLLDFNLLQESFDYWITDAFYASFNLKYRNWQQMAVKKVLLAVHYPA